MTSIYNLPINFNTPKLNFKGLQTVYPQRGLIFGDRFNTSPAIDNSPDKTQIEIAAKSNPRIMEIMQKYKLPVKANIDELEKLQQGHLKDTRVVIAKMYSALPVRLKNQVNLKDVQEAAMYHDYGKVLIPKPILNKASALTKNEREIIEQHSELSYELLKDKGLNKNTLNLIKYHHQTIDRSGYPDISDNFEFGIESQILSIADKYSALREERSYKKAMSQEEALAIIYNDVKKGAVSPEVYDTLVRATQY